MQSHLISKSCKDLGAIDLTVCEDWGGAMGAEPGLTQEQTMFQCLTQEQTMFQMQQQLILTQTFVVLTVPRELLQLTMKYPQLHPATNLNIDINQQLGHQSYPQLLCLFNFYSKANPQLTSFNLERFGFEQFFLRNCI